MMVVVALTWAVGVTGCGSSAVANPRVLLVGDSILHSAQLPVFVALRRAGWEPVVAGVGGSHIQDWPLLTAELVRKQHPAIAVVELGTNNCPTGGACTDLQTRIDRLMTILESVQQVLWLNVQQDVPLANNAKFVNAQLKTAAGRWPTMKIVDFNGDFAGHPDLNLPDQIHLSPEGIGKFTHLIVDSLAPYHPSS
jgi:GDSL-like lipase/acylhydrolase family protein